MKPHVFFQTYVPFVQKFKKDIQPYIHILRVNLKYYSVYLGYDLMIQKTLLKCFNRNVFQLLGLHKHMRTKIWR